MSEPTKVSISTHEEAYALVERALAGEFENELLDIDFTGDWSTLMIKVSGENYHATLNGRLVRALSELQTQLNRLYANAAYGKSAKALSNEEREEIELVFQVSDGSTNVLADLGTWATSIADTAIDKMTGTEIAVVVVGLALVWAGSRAIQQHNERKQQETEQEHDSRRHEATLKAENERHEKLVGQMAASNETVRMALQERSQFESNVLRSTPTAESVEISGRQFSRDEIEEASRTERQTTELTRRDGVYYVNGIVTKAEGFNVSLEDVHGAAFRADLTRGKLDEEELEDLWSALRDATPASLKVAARVRDDAIVSATIIGMADQVPSPHDPH